MKTSPPRSLQEAASQTGVRRGPDIIQLAAGGLLAWLTWLSVTLIDIQQEVTADSERVSQLESEVGDHEQRIRSLEQP